MTASRSTLPPRIARFVLGAVLLLAPVQYARAAVVTPPPPPPGALGSNVTITPAAAYPRGAATNWTVKVNATEGATFSTAASGPDLTTRFTGCAPTSCTMSTQGVVTVNPDADTIPNEPVTVTMTGTATPAATVPLRSTEGQPMQATMRQLTIVLKPTGNTTGATETKSAPLPVTVNLTTQSAIELTTLAPTDPTVAVRGGAVPYRATVTRTGSTANETLVNMRLIPGTEGVSGTTTLANAMVSMAPGVATVTVQLSVQVPLDAPEGIATWRLQATWNAIDVEVGLPRSFTVPPAPPAPAPVPVPIPVAPAPQPVVGPPVAAAVVTPIDTTRPAVGVQLLSGTRILVPNGTRPKFPMRYTCPKTEKSCKMVATVTWRPGHGAKPVQLGIGKLFLKGGTSGKSTFILSARARTLLRRYGVLRVLLVVTATDASGNVATGKLPVVLRLVKTTPRH